MRKVQGLLLLTLSGFIVALVCESACSSQPAATAPAVEKPAAPTLTPVGTVKEIMKGIVDPTSMAIWDAVGTESGKNGVVEKAPKTDEEWAKVEHNALMLAEAANLLKMPNRQMARAEEANTKSAPDAPELTPVQIAEKVNKDRAAWEKKADALQATAVKAIAAAKAHDKDGVLNVGEEIDNACESCHVVYWYPDEKKPGGAPAVGEQSANKK
jgi:cytochrome c556